MINKETIDIIALYVNLYREKNQTPVEFAWSFEEQSNPALQKEILKHVFLNHAPCKCQAISGGFLIHLT